MRLQDSLIWTDAQETSQPLRDGGQEPTYPAVVELLLCPSVACKVKTSTPRRMAWVAWVSMTLLRSFALGTGCSPDAGELRSSLASRTLTQLA